jgi:hypothetical protein
MEDVGLWIVTGTDHSFAPLSQCAVTTNILAILSVNHAKHAVSEFTKGLG